MLWNHHTINGVVFVGSRHNYPIQAADYNNLYIAHSIFERMGKKVPTLEFGLLKFDENARRNIERVLDRTYIIAAGEEVEGYQEKWKELFGYQHCVATYSGTGADTVACKVLYDLHPQAKRSLNLSDNDIIVPALAFIAAGSSIVDAGFKPVFVDIERETLNINPRKIEEKITYKTRGIMAVHTMGKPCEMDTIVDIARRHGLYVIEDSCEAHCARYKGTMIGQWGDIATFSSYISHMICSVEGGMIATNNPTIASIARSLRNHGRRDGSTYFEHERLGGNYKMHDLEAAVGLAAVEQCWNIFYKRKANLYRLLEQTKDLQEVAIMNIERPYEQVCPHAFTVTIRNPGQYDPGEMYAYLNNNPIMDIRCKRNFGSMPTQQKAFEFLGHRRGEFPEAEHVGTYGVHFGIHQYTDVEQIDAAADVLHLFFNHKKE